MIFKDYIGYIEGMDLSKIPLNYLAYPSKNLIIRKHIAYTRPGITNDGNAPTAETKVIGERTWKDALGGEKPLRVISGGKVQVKWNGTWITIFTGVSGTAVRVRFDTWIDDSGAIIKKRIFFVDGTDAVYEWNGAIATVATVNAGGHSLTFSENSTGLKLGFDDGSGSSQPVQIVRFVAGVAATPDTYSTDSTMSAQTIHMTGAFSNVPAVGDLVMGQVVKHTDVLAGINKDEIYTYKNHIGLANLTSITVYFSDAESKLDFTIPAAIDRTALSAFLVNLDGNFTAMIARLDASLKQTVLWISSVDDWTKINLLDAADSNGEWIAIEQVFNAQRTGALPFCVAIQKGDIIFFAQDRTIQRVETIDVLSKDSLKLLSDEVNGYLERVDVDEARIYYLERYIYLVLPAEANIFCLDIVEGHFMPPWTIGASCMSVITGVLCGHSNSRDETFTMLTGTSDLGVEIESVFAFGYYQGFQFHRGKTIPQDFQQKQFGKIGVSCRMNASANALVEEFFESEGSKAKDSFLIAGGKVATYSAVDDEGWGSHEWGDASIGGSDDPANPLKRVMAFSIYDALAWFEFTAKMTVTGKDQQFVLLGFFIDDSLATRVIPDTLFIDRKNG